MAKYKKFNFGSLEELEAKISELGLGVRMQTDLSPLSRTVKVGGKTAANAFAALPMEGCDSEEDGSPSQLVRRRYLRLAAGGYGLLWWEACAVTPEGKANGLQMMLTEENAAVFAALVSDVKDKAKSENGIVPINILQLTHSGRYSRPAGHTPRPIIAQRDPVLDPRSGVCSDDAVASDEYLESLVPKYIHSAQLAQEAGFDGVDIKCCHRYLLSELLASRTRNGKYGGSFENRTRLILKIVREIKKACGENLIVSCRFNAFDAHPYPYGFGVSADDMWLPDTEEPEAFTRALCEAGVELLSVSAGNPYYIYPQVGRPFDAPLPGGAEPDEHPLESAARLFQLTGEIQKAAGDVPVIGCGYTWLRGFMPFAAAANLMDGACGFAGLGRLTFAYPDAPRDILSGKGFEQKKCCITCSKCTEIMRCHGRTGCVIRDGGVYAPLYKQYRDEAAERGRREKK